MCVPEDWRSAQDWDAARDGGCLRVHHSGDGARDIAPTLGRIVLFESRAVWHEVLPATRPRRAATIWVDRAQTAPETPAAPETQSVRLPPPSMESE